MQRKHNKLDFTGQDIFIGLDVHKKHWSVIIYVKEIEHKRYTQPPEVDILKKYLEKHFPGGNYYSVYEAGYSGFWIDRELKEAGINNIVVNPADVPTSNKEKRRKTDEVDSKKLVRALLQGQLKGIYVPDEESDYDKRLTRQSEFLTKKMTRCKNQIKGLLSQFGIQIGDEETLKHWSKSYIERLKQLSDENKNLWRSLCIYIEELEFLKNLKLTILRDIRKLSLTSKYKTDCELITSIPGISTLSAMIILTEITDIKRFTNKNQFCSYIGYTPDERSSGEISRILGLTYRKNAHLRRIITEAAWIAMRKDPALLLKFNEYVNKRKIIKAKAIIKIARKLACRIRHVLISRQKYELGVVV